MSHDVIGVLRSFVASEEGVRKQAILPVAWVGAVLMAGAVLLSMPTKADASTCWAAWCPNTSPSVNCPQSCQSSCGQIYGTCTSYGSSGQKRCKCSWS